jgi:hypothetical protein
MFRKPEEEKGDNHLSYILSREQLGMLGSTLALLKE